MNQQQIIDTLYRHTNDITTITRQVNELDAKLNNIILEQEKTKRIIEEHIKNNFEIINLKREIEVIDNAITDFNLILKNIEISLVTKDVLDEAKSNLKNDLKKYLPALLILCASMFIFGLIIDDMKIIHTIFGK